MSLDIFRLRCRMEHVPHKSSEGRSNRGLSRVINNFLTCDNHYFPVYL